LRVQTWGVYEGPFSAITIEEEGSKVTDWGVRDEIRKKKALLKKRSRGKKKFICGVQRSL